jgi:pantetheine-phosphate adenylyltransferase
MANWTVGLGGSFDHLHAGHELLLQVAFDIGTKVIIGLASDALLEHKRFKEYLQSYEEREQNLVEFARNIGRDGDVTIIKLEDKFGPAITEPDIDMHVSSEETFPVAQEINNLRRQNGLTPLILVMIPMVLKDDGVRYSSTEFRGQLAKNV